MQLEIKSASYVYSPRTAYEKTAVNNVSVQIEKGEFVGVMGKTGSGKSTLLQLLGGLMKPQSGNVLFYDEDINSKYFDRKKFRKSVGVLFQFPDYQLFETTVFRDVAFSLKNTGCNKSKIEAKVKYALEAVGFDYDKVKNQSPLGFSGGEKRKIAFAGVLAAEPDILLLDEPVAGLDLYGKKDFLSLAQKLNKNGTTIVMVSHNAEVLSEYASRIILMKDGRIAADSSTAEVLSDEDLLSGCGLQSAPVCRISQSLREKGIDISEKTIQYEQFIDEISRCLGRESV